MEVYELPNWQDIILWEVTIGVKAWIITSRGITLEFYKLHAVVNYAEFYRNGAFWE